jgi:putative phosphoribosyl transferase
MTITRREVHIPVNGVILTGDLQIPPSACGLVLFVHGSGSSRLSSRNRQVADFLNRSRLGTLLFDLLSPEEEQIDLRTRELRFDIGLLADRVDGATKWLDNDGDLSSLPVGYFGASTGAAAALAASIRHKATVKAVVSRGGRPDLAAGALLSVTAPTLLIVGSLDSVVIDLNREALNALKTEAKLEIVEGASHLFEEPGKLDVVSRLAADWFTSHLPGAC